MNLTSCLLALCGFVPFLWHGPLPTPPPPPDVVCWQEGRKLTWDDFQAVAKPVLAKKDRIPGALLYATTEANAIVYDRKTTSGEYLKTFVRVEFDKRKSWINKATYDDRKATLLHEQLHFDIVELTGRKLRRVLARCAAQRIDSHAPAITEEMTGIYNKESTLQRLCDKDTKGGDDLKAQARWQASVNKQLDALRAYQSTPADCEMPPQLATPPTGK